MDLVYRLLRSSPSMIFSSMGQHLVRFVQQILRTQRPRIDDNALRVCRVHKPESSIQLRKLLDVEPKLLLIHPEHRPGAPWRFEQATELDSLRRTALANADKRHECDGEHPQAEPHRCT